MNNEFDVSKLKGVLLEEAVQQEHLRMMKINNALSEERLRELKIKNDKESK